MLFTLPNWLARGFKSHSCSTPLNACWMNDLEHSGGEEGLKVERSFEVLSTCHWQINTDNANYFSFLTFFLTCHKKKGFQYKIKILQAMLINSRKNITEEPTPSATNYSNLKMLVAKKSHLQTNCYILHVKWSHCNRCQFLKTEALKVYSNRAVTQLKTIHSISCGFNRNY